jgi:hypothetical protein
VVNFQVAADSSGDGLEVTFVGADDEVVAAATVGQATDSAPGA